MSTIQESDKVSKAAQSAVSMSIFQQIQRIEQDSKQIDELISVMLTMPAEWSTTYTEFEDWIENRRNYRDQMHDVGFADAGEEPQYLNCWEAILYAATQAGLIGRRKLLSICNANGGAKDSGGVARKVLNLAGARPVQLNNGLPINVKKGQILFFHGTSHVAVATDNVGNVIQLWSWAGRTRTATFQELLGAMSQGGDKSRIRFLRRYLQETPSASKAALEASSLSDVSAVIDKLYDAEDDPSDTDAMSVYRTLWKAFCGPLPINGETEQVMVSTPKWS